MLNHRTSQNKTIQGSKPKAHDPAPQSYYLTGENKDS